MIKLNKLKNVVLAGALIVLGSCVGKKTVADKPNIVFIFTDDQSYSTIHALGNDEISTPNFDGLVKEGTTFTHAYNMGAWSGAVCTASRAMINSGRFVWRANKFRKNWSKNDSLNQTWSKLMEGAGYDTYMTGKWHVDADAEKIFKYVVHKRPGMPSDYWKSKTVLKKLDSIKGIEGATSGSVMPVGYNRPLHANDTSWLPWDKKHGGFWQGGTHWSEVLRDDAIGFIDQAKQKDTPFFMYLAFNAPHDPRQAPKEFVDKYPLENISLPDSYLAEYPYRHGIRNGDYVRDEALAPFPRTPYAVKVQRQEYYASISHLDAQIGAIVAALKASGKMDNTYILLTSDHGLAMGRHGFMGKQNLYDHSIRPPMIIVGPDIPKDKRSSADVYLQDVMATSLELAGVEKPAYVEFKSFLDLAKNQSDKSHYDAIYGGYRDVQRMIRKNGYKLLVYPQVPKLRLYNVANDPKELIDLSDDPAQKERIKTMLKELVELQKDMDDPLELSGIFKDFE